ADEALWHALDPQPAPHAVSMPDRSSCRDTLMVKTMLPLSRPWLGDAEIEAAAEAIRQGCGPGDGPFCKRAEATLAAVLDGRRSLFMSSCTTALEAAVWLSGVGPGDEVILPSFTF